jgi:hypothetical protein
MSTANLNPIRPGVSNEWLTVAGCCHVEENECALLRPQRGGSQ